MAVLATIRRALLQALSPMTPARGRGGWWTVIHEPSTGAWQKNEDIRADTVLSYPAVFSCVSLIATSIGKVRFRLVEQDDEGIWHETSNAAWNPVLRKPNRFQIFVKYVEQYILSKLLNGNAYVLKQRDGRNVVVGFYVLDPLRVTPLVTPSGDVYYELRRDDLSGLPLEVYADGRPLVVPASEIIHDPMICLFHPLIGVSPLYACGLAAIQGLSIQNNSSRFFSNGSRPGGILIAPTEIGDEEAKKLKQDWETGFSGENAGRVAVVGYGMKYEPLGLSAVESQLIDQLNWTTDTICSCYHVPPFLVTGKTNPYGNNEPLLQLFYSQCLQELMNTFEVNHDEGLELPKPFGTEFDIDDLIWMDTATKTEAAQKSVSSGTVSPNEARKKYFGLGPVTGGDSPYMQQQMFSLEALAKRDAEDPFPKATPAAPALPPTDDDEEDDDIQIKKADSFDGAAFLAAMNG